MNQRLPAAMAASALASDAATFRIAQFQFTWAPEQERPALEKAMGPIAGPADWSRERVAKGMRERSAGRLLDGH